MLGSINLTSNLNHDDKCSKDYDKDCGEKHKLRVANAILKLAIDVNTDFDCNTGDTDKD